MILHGDIRSKSVFRRIMSFAVYSVRYKRLKQLLKRYFIACFPECIICFRLIGRKGEKMRLSKHHALRRAGKDSALIDALFGVFLRRMYFYIFDRLPKTVCCALDGGETSIQPIQIHNFLSRNGRVFIIGDDVPIGAVGFFIKSGLHMVVQTAFVILTRKGQDCKDEKRDELLRFDILLLSFCPVNGRAAQAFVVFIESDGLTGGDGALIDVKFDVYAVLFGRDGDGSQ